MNRWLKIGLRVHLLLLVTTCVGTSFAQPVIEKGTVDLRNWDFTKRAVRLDGQWGFYWEELLTPGQAPATTKRFHQFPGIWTEGQGFATYTADVIVDHDLPMLSMELPDFYSNYHLWVNGIAVAANGEVGTSRKEAVPQWLPKTIVFPASDTLHIMLQVSNFHHMRGGSNDHIYLGLPDQLYQKRETAVITNIILFAGLGLIGCFFIVLFLFFRKEKAALYFAAICLTWALRAVVTNLYLFSNWFPAIDWELLCKIEYLTLYLTMMWSLLYVGKLFPDDVNAILKYGLLILNSIFILFTIATPAITYTNLLPAYKFVAWIILGYVGIVVIRAIFFDRAGAWFSAISIILGVLMFSYDMITYEGFLDFSPLLFNVGYLTIFFLNATAFAYQLSRTVNPKPKKVEFEFTVVK
jgi:hypothetical protein